MAVMAIEGDDAVRVARIAKDAGVTTGALYAHFVDRDDLISAAHVEFIRREVRTFIDNSVDVREAEIQGAISPEQLAPFLRTLLEPGPMAERRRWAEAALNSARRPTQRIEVSEVIASFVDNSAESIRRARELHTIRQDVDPRALALAQLATTVGLAIFTELYDDSPEMLDAVAKVWALIPTAFDAKSDQGGQRATEDDQSNSDA